MSTKRTKRFGISVAALAIAGLGAACVPGPAPGPPAGGGGCAGGPPDATTSAIYNATNASRQSAGLPGLGWNAQLHCLASEWSNNMASQGRMFHRDLGTILGSPSYSGFRTIGENVLFGPSNMSGGSMHQAWMNSPPHQANIMSGAFSSFAVATAHSGGQVFATANFGG